MKWFKEVTSVEELRSQYKTLALKNHPDVGGSVKAMQEINSEYDTLFARLKAEKKEDKETYNNDENEEDKAFRVVLNQIISYNMTIEIIGSWIWYKVYNKITQFVADNIPHFATTKVIFFAIITPMQRRYYMYITTIKITTLSDLNLLSQAYLKGEIKLNISKLAKELDCDRKTVRKYLKGEVPKGTRTRIKYLDQYKTCGLSTLF